MLILRFKAKLNENVYDTIRIRLLVYIKVGELAG